MCAVFQKISGSQKVYGLEGGYQELPSKIFCLTVRKNLIGETLRAVFQKISGGEKVYG